MKTGNKLLRIVLALALVLALLPAAASTGHAAAVGGSCGENLTWKLENGTLTVSGTGPMEDFIWTTIPWNDWKDSVERVEIKPGVTSIGRFAITYMKNLKSVVISDTVTDLGESAIQGCNELEELTMPGNMNTVGDYFLLNCNKLHSVTFTAGKTGYVSGLVTRNLPKNNEMEITIAPGVTAVYDGAFREHKNVVSVSLPDTLTSIGEQAFFRCDALKSINIPEGITRLEPWVLYGCKLTELTLPDSLTYIGEKALGWNTKLETVVIPNHVTTIGYGAFRWCYDLHFVTVPDSVTFIDNDAFADSGLRGVKLGKGLRELGRSAFGGCRIDGVIFQGDAPEKINSKAFENTTAKVYYPADNKTWTADVRQDYSGTLSWLGSSGGPIITAQSGGATARVGDRIRFTVMADGVDLTYQWQIKTSANAKWVNSTAVTGNSESLKVSVIPGRNGYQYRCIVTDDLGIRAISSPVKLKVKPEIITQPQDLDEPAGSTAYLTVEAVGAGLKYQWQIKTPTSSQWVNSTLSSGTTDTLKVNVISAKEGYQYRCVITDANGVRLYSNTASLTVRPGIVTQPKDISAKAGTTVYFTVKAEGPGLKYQWQIKTPGSDRWVNSTLSSGTTNSLKVSVTKAKNGYQYRCVIVDANSVQMTTSVARLTVK